MQPSRRTFLIHSAAAVSALAAGKAALAQAPGKVDEKDAQAAALGYHDDASKTDKAKFPKYAADQKCSGCQLFAGKAGDKAGACPIFGGKLVAAGGWCSAWVKKA